MRTCVGWARGIDAQHIIGLALLVVALFTAQAPTLAQEADWSGLIEQAKPAVVWIVVETSEGTSAGSGALISPNGYILTAGHVVSGASKITVVVDDSREYRATVTEADYDMDVAVLKIPASGLTWLALGDSDDVGYDEEIRVLGYPLPGHAGVGFAAVAGKIQGFRANDGVWLLQHDAPTEGGHSGGAVINSQGEIVAVHTSWIGGEHSQYTIGVAINSAKGIIPYGVLPRGPSPVQPTTPGTTTAVLRVPQDFADLASAVRAAADGSEIQVARGTYYGDVSITKPLTIAGEDGAVIRGSIRILSADSTYLRDLAIVGGVEVRNSNGVTLESLVLQDSQGDGVFVAEASVSVRDCAIVRHQGDGVAATFESRLMISNCLINENMGTGINVALGSQASINGNAVTANGSDGIAVFGATADLRNNVLRQNEGYGLNADASATLFGTGNQAGGDVPEEFATITAAVRALNEQGGKSSAVPAGIISSAITIGSGIYEESIDIAYSVDLIGAGPTLTVVRGVRISGTAQVMIQDLAVMENSGEGISVEDSARTTIENCTISENDGCGIILWDTAQAALENSRISGNESSGIQLSHASQATIENCNISGNEGSGIILTGTAQATMENCTIAGNSSYGIFLMNTPEARIENCTISENDCGVYLSPGAVPIAAILNSDINNNISAGIYACYDISGELTGHDYGGVTGHDNRMSNNGVDLEGDLPGSLRTLLEPATQQEIRYPDPRYNSLQSAVDALIAGGRLILQAGVYEAGVTIAKRIEISAMEEALVTLQGRSENAPVLSLVHGADLTLTGLVLTKGSRGLSLGGDAEATIESCTISGNSDYGMYLMDTAKATIENCTISGNVYGIRLISAAKATMEDCTISENKYGVYLKDTAEATIEDCTISESKYGVYLSDTAEATIVNNDINNNISAGIYAYVVFAGGLIGHNNRMSNNGVDLAGNVPGALRAPLEPATQQEIRYPDPRYNSLQSAVDALIAGGRLILQAGVYEAGVTIAKRIEISAMEGALVTLQGRSDDALVLSLVSNGDLTLTEVVLAKGYGGLFLSGDAEATIERCTISENGYGVRLYDTAQAAIGNCTISGSGRFGILLGGTTETTMIDCTISESKYGVYLSDTAEATIENCNISGNGGSGILIERSAQATIENCIIANNDTTGIQMWGSAQATVKDCTISGNAWSGIGIDGTAQAAIVNSRITNNDSYGIRCRDFTGQVTGSDNIIPGPGEPNGNTDGALSPVYPGAPWPDGFLKE